jgi:SWI/SNF-related matrix-associated actin-dependent regulator 1 of chromatin subfamily A
MEFQTSGVRYIIHLKGRGLIGDEMGLGKTVQALALVAAYKEHWPVLVITPSSLRIQWADAIHEWLRVTEEHVSVVSSGKDTKKLDNRFVVISYDFIPKMHHLLKEKKFQMIVCDEAHYIKNHKAKRSKDTLPLLQQAKHVVLLTGTPALSRPIELLQQLRAIHPKVVRSIKEYGDRYCTGGFFNQYNQYNGASNLKELHKVVTSTTMIRRLKKDVLSQLPAKRRQQVSLPITATESKELKAITSKMDAIKEALKDGSADSESIFSGEFARKQGINELYLKSGEIKSKAVCDYLSLLLEAEEKFLVFAHHKCVLNSIESLMREKKVQFIRIDGSTPATDRSGLVKKFQENEVYRAAVLSIKAAGVGLTLTAASLVIMAELDWTPGNLVQAEDRAHRIGQACSVNVHYLHMKGSIDDIIWQTLQNKLENVGTLLDGCNDSLNVEKGGKSKISTKAKRNSADTSEDSRSGKRQSNEKTDAVNTQPTMDTYFKPRS